MKRLRLCVALAGLTVTAACGAGDGYDRSAAYDALKQQLRDPGSAQFQDEAEYEHAGWKAYCGTVNSKNGFGGYSGATQFAVLQKKDGGSAALIDAPGEIEETISSVITRSCTADPNMPFVPPSGNTTS